MVVPSARGDLANLNSLTARSPRTSRSSRACCCSCVCRGVPDNARRGRSHLGRNRHRAGLRPGLQLEHRLRLF